MPAGDLRNYDSDQYFLSVAGIPISGYADGEFVRVERDNPAFDDVVGTDGEVTRSKTNDGRATATVRLMQTSPSNDLLSALHNSDKAAPGGVGVGPFLLQDLQGTTILFGEKCWIMKEPDLSLDRTATEREWEVRIANLISTHGGSTV
jgi:hypothetical protein